MTRPATDESPPPHIVFDDGAGYEQLMGHWSVLVAEPFLDWLALPRGLRWLDVGCGNGAFTARLLSRCGPCSVIAIDPSPAQLAFARQRPGLEDVRFVDGDARSLPLPDASVDVAVMALVLFFVETPLQALRESGRVVQRGGTVAAYHWDLGGGGLPLQPILDALRAAGHRPAEPPSASMASPEASVRLWHSAGLVDVRTRPIHVCRRFASFEAFWRTAYGSARLRNLFNGLPPADLHRLQEAARQRIGAGAGGPVVVDARATAVSGRVR